MMELIQQLGFLPLLVSGISGYSARNAVTSSFLKADGIGRCGNGKVSSSTRAIASMASSSTARRVLSAARGGGISATGVAVSIPCRRTAV